jgi:F-type H+-transporting ATPase subunit gamma
VGGNLCRAEGQKNDLVVIGEKGRAQLQRDQASHIKETIADVGKVRITFAQASFVACHLPAQALDKCSVAFKDALTVLSVQAGAYSNVSGVCTQVSAIAEELLKTEYDAVRIIFNRFQSAISFKPTIATVLSPDALEKEVESDGSLDVYEVEGPDRAELLQDLAEFHLAAVSWGLSA